MASPVQLAWQVEPDLPINDGTTPGVLAYCRPCGWRTFVGQAGQRQNEEMASLALEIHRRRCPVRTVLEVARG